MPPTPSKAEREKKKKKRALTKKKERERAPACLEVKAASMHTQGHRETRSESSCPPRETVANQRLPLRHETLLDKQPQHIPLCREVPLDRMGIFEASRRRVIGLLNVHELS